MPPSYSVPHYPPLTLSIITHTHTHTPHAHPAHAHTHLNPDAASQNTRRYASSSHNTLIPPPFKPHLSL